MFSAVSIKEAKYSFGQLVRLLRKKEKLTQQELGDRLGLSRMTIQNLEAGKNGTLDTVFILMQHFDLLSVFHKEIETQITNNSYDSLY